MKRMLILIIAATAATTLGSGYGWTTIHGIQYGSTAPYEPNWTQAKEFLHLDHMVDVRDYGADGNGVADDSAEIQAAIDAATDGGGLLCFPPGTYAVDANLVVDPNVHLVFMPGATLEIATGVDVTLAYPSQIVAQPRQQIFTLTGTGAVWFAGTTTYGYLLGTVSPCWWGAVGDDDANDTAALQAAIDAAPDPANDALSRGLTVQIPWGNYHFSHLHIPGRTIIHGEELRSTILERIAGETGAALADKGYAIGIHISRIDVHCSDCVGDAIELGVTTNADSPVGGNQWGWNGLLDRVRVQDANGLGLNLKTNGNTIRNIQITGCEGSVIAGSSTHIIGFHDSSYIPTTDAATPFGLKLTGQNHRIVGFHGEGVYSTAGIYVDATGSSVLSADCTVGEGKTLPAVVYLATNRNDCSLFGISAYAYEGTPDGVITALVVDDSYTTQRVEPGFQGEAGGIRTRFLVDYFAGRQRNDIRNTGTAYVPTEGSWLRGDRVLTESTAGFPNNLVCTTAGTPGSWSPVGTIPGAVAKTSDYHIGGRAVSNASETGKRFSNAGAGAAVTFTLRPVAVTDEYEFVSVVSGQVLRVDPNDTQIFFGQGAGKYLELDQGERVRIGYGEAGTWYIINQVGTPAYEAP